MLSTKELAELGVKSIEVLSLQPGDKLVLTFEKDVRATSEAVQAIKAQMEEHFPDHEIVVLGGGLSLKTVRAATEDEHNQYDQDEEGIGHSW